MQKWVDDPNLPYSNVEFKEIEMFQERARLYGDRTVEWSKTDIRFYTDSGEEQIETYWFTVETFDVNFRKMREHFNGEDLETFDKLDATKYREV